MGRASAFGLSATWVLFLGCRQPTQVEIEITTDHNCDEPISTGVTLGKLGKEEIDTRSPQAVTGVCVKGSDVNSIGTITVAPSGNDDEGFRVVVAAHVHPEEGDEAHAVSADRCAPPDYVGCIVARRTLGFVPREGLTLPIFLQSACADLNCGEVLTCVVNPVLGPRCVSPEVKPPGDCYKSGNCTFPKPTPSPSDPAPVPPPVPLPVSLGDIYVNTAKQLFKFHPGAEQPLEELGTFSGCSKAGGTSPSREVRDIAVNNKGEILGVTNEGVFQIDPKTLKCTLKYIAPSSAYSMAFMPGEVFGPSAVEEILVGYNDNLYADLNPMSGMYHVDGMLDQGYTISGDIVTVKASGVVKSYVTVYKGMDTAHDFLSEIDPKTGALQPKRWALPHGEFQGLAFLGGIAYAFSKAGSVVSIDTSTDAVGPEQLLLDKPAFLGAASRSAPSATTP